MLVNDAVGTPQVRVEEIIAQQIVHRTWGRIHRLRVELTDEAVLVWGETSTYYLKQMALQGAMEAIEATGPSCIDLRIDVGRSLSEAASRNRLWSNEILA